jgi:hypothetical protein
MDINERINVQKLEIESEEKGFKGWIKSKQVKKTIIAILIGAVAGFAYFYFTEGQEMEVIQTSDIIQDVVFGAFLGFFVTNSPCARNKC